MGKTARLFYQLNMFNFSNTDMYDFHRKKNFINNFSLMYANNTFLDKIYTSSNLLLGPKIKSKYLFLYKTNILFLTLHSLSFASM